METLSLSQFSDGRVALLASEVKGGQREPWRKRFRIRGLGLFEPGETFLIVAADELDVRHADQGRDIPRVLREDSLVSFPGACRIPLLDIELRKIHQAGN